jgi:UDPglucose 6-dehydrogenase
VIGCGYVGLVTGACLAEIGHTVTCLDNNKKKIKTLLQGEVPFFEPKLAEMILKNKKTGRLFFSADLKEAIKKNEIIFVAVGTPAKENGEADLTNVEAVARQIARAANGYKLIIEKSTVPAETGEWIKKTINLYNTRKIPFDVASNPEFLREGSAIDDFMKPDRIVIGVESSRAEEIMKTIYAPLKARIVVTDIKSAEIIKHASNSFLALKISYINAISNICEAVGADVKKVAEGMGYDKRIGPRFLEAGIGYGGSCFPKDIKAFIHMAREARYDFELLKIIEKINHAQRERAVKKIKEILWILNGKTICVLGLAFKPNTDDLREAPALEIIPQLIKEGAKIKTYDPVATTRARQILKNVQFCRNPYEAARGSDLVFIATEWEEFRKIDWGKIKKLMRVPAMVDGRNFFDPEKMKKLGFIYKGFGR